MLLPENEVEKIISQKNIPLKNSFAIGELFTEADVLEAKQMFEDAKLGNNKTELYSLSSRKVKPQRQHQTSENSYLILSGMALVF